MRTIKQLLNGQKIVPVVTVENKQQAIGLAGALIDGGIGVIEITLRNHFALQAIELVKYTYPKMLIFAGTVNNAQALVNAVNAGADGIVSPGLTDSLLNTALQQKTAYLPGVATSSEILTGMQYGLHEFKLFPAHVCGGVKALQALSGPFPGIHFCPTGGINGNNYKEFLNLPNVMCVGGTWIAPATMISANDWASITRISTNTQNR